VIGGALHLAIIYLHPGQQDALRRYENLALPVFRRHGGRFERILAAPDEMRFETPEGLDAVRRDPEMAALAPLRREIVRKALLVRVDDVQLERYFKPG
jgi:hypothetical protein